MTCTSAHLDAAYVLGALSDEERSAYEAHLIECEDCTRSVAELRDLPPLLGLVPLPAIDAALDADQAEPPSTLLPHLQQEVRRPARDRIRLTVLAVAAAVLLVVGIGAVVVATRDDEPPSASPAEVTTAPAERMASNTAWFEGWVSLTEVAWGTRIDLTCTYGGHGDGGQGDGWPAYRLLVLTADGAEDAGSWRAEPGKETHISAPVATPLDEIVAVQVTDADGVPVLTLER